MFRLLVILTLADATFGAVGKWAVYSTKTAYYWAHNPAEPGQDAEYQKTVDNKVCKAAHVTMLLRHGSRFPSDSATDEIAALRAQLEAHTAGPVYQDVVNWQSNYTQDDADQLCPEGEEEQFDIGRRTGLRYRSLFMNNGRYIKFVSSSKTRNTDSSRNFYHGLKNVVDGIGSFDNEINKTLMRFYDGCENYENQVEDNETHMEEFTKYEKSAEFMEIQEKLQNALNYTVTQDDVYLIYELCAYDKYIHNKTSFWCELLSDADRDILEYGQDLENYYEKAYTHPVIPKMTCPLMRDMFHTMDKSINAEWDYENLPTDAAEQGYLAGKFFDGHSTTVITTLTALGLYKDSTPLLASNRQAMENRLFRSSILAPFSSNIAFVVYSCDSSGTDSQNTFMLQVRVNEEPVTLPGCDSIFCPYSQVRSRYRDLIENCDLTEVCSSKDSDGPTDQSPPMARMNFVICLLILLSLLVL